MPLRSLLAFALLVVAFSGCADPSGPTSAGTGDGPTATPSEETVGISCRLVDEEGTPLARASCEYSSARTRQKLATNESGQARFLIPRGEHGTLRGEADGRVSKSVAVVANAEKDVQIVLQRSGTAASPTPTSPPTPSSPGPGTGRTSPSPGPSTDPPAVLRTWENPVSVTQNGNEPHLVVDSKGVIYFSPANQLWRSKDGGKTFVAAGPDALESPPTLGSDTSLSVAPDDSVWWSRYWGYLASTVGCTSTNQGDTWTCNNGAVPGVTDRMWIVGLSSSEGYVQAGEALTHPVWARTTTGSQTYVPHATSTTTKQHGNMVLDQKNNAVWQITNGNNQELMRIDGGGGLIGIRGSTIPATYTLPSIAAHDGVLWTTGEPAGQDQSRRVVAARSSDGGQTWQQFPVSQVPKSATFSAVAAGPDGRVAVAYYGSDAAGHPESNPGKWSLYVAETDDALSEFPTWTETRIVPIIHTGHICAYAGCDDPVTDPYARFAGDLLGVWIDGGGDVHVAYNQDVQNHAVWNMYIRQTHPVT